MATNATQSRESNLKTVLIQDGPNGKIYNVTLPSMLAQQVETGDPELCSKILDNIRQAAIPSAATEPIAMESDTVPGPTDAEVLSNNAESDPSDVDDNEQVEYTEGNSSKGGESLWTREATLLLITLYKQNESKMESLGCRKKTVWGAITLELNRKYNFTQTQVESKWRGLVRSYKKVVDNKKQTGAKRISFQYYNEMEEVLSRRHDIQPPVLLSSAPSTEDSTNEQRKKFCVRPSISTERSSDGVVNINSPANVDIDELSDSDKSDLNSSVSSEKSDSNLRKSESKSAKRRRESRKAQSDAEDVAMQTLALLKNMEENRREDQKRVATQIDERNNLLKQLIETLKK